MKTLTISNPIDFFYKVIELTKYFGDHQLWWRGHTNEKWKLLPSIIHKGLAANESNLNGLFIQHGFARYKNVPAYDEYANWMFLMQHYGLPTRILDWTKSPIVALYFAIHNASIENDAAVWCLLPTKLNKCQIGSDKLVSMNNPEVKKSIYNAFSKTVENSNYNIAFIAQHIDMRQLIQASEFTIHSNTTPLEEMEDSSEFVGKIILPRSQIKGLKQLLFVLNITQAYLFPDLENLSEYLLSIDFA